MDPTVDPRAGAFVARQPILDAAGQVFGYELLYRAAADHTACHDSGDCVAARVLNDAVLTLGLDLLTGGRRAFINLTRHLLLSDVATLLPAAGVVIELLEDIAIDAEIIRTCRKLRDDGYWLALDDFTFDTGAKALLPFVRFVKVDVLTTSGADCRAIQEAMPRGVRLIAEKVETAQMFAAARTAGCTLFQGYYFCRPATLAMEPLPMQRLAYARLLAEVNGPHVSLHQLEDLIKHDASLSVRVLRCVQSAALGLRCEVQSIRQALVILGVDQVRKWASVWALAGLSGGGPELVTTGILRARCCELVASRLMPREEASEYFLLGLCSLLDVMLGQPMPAALGDLPLGPHVRRALLGERNRARAVLDTVIAYAQGAWDEAAQGAQALGVKTETLRTAYTDALRWARVLA